MPSVRVNVIGDASSLRKAYAQSAAATKAFGANVSETNKTMERARAHTFALVQTLIGTGAGIALGTALKASISQASDLNEQLNKTTVVFKSSAESVKKWSLDSASAMGIARNEALAYASTFGNLLVPMGFARKSAADMSTHLVKLASDLASFNNASPKETLEALRSGLTGEVEPLRKFGVFLSQSRVEAEALSSGIVKADRNTRAISEAQQRYAIAADKAREATAKYGAGTREAAAANLTAEKAADAVTKAVAGHVPALTAAQKALATYHIILKDTKDAQGDFGRTSGGLANQQRILTAGIHDLEAAVGTALMPVLTDGIKVLNKWITHLNESGDAAKYSRETVAVIKGIVKDMIPVVQAAADVFKAFADHVGGTKRAIEILGAAFATWKIASTISGIGAAAGGAAPGVATLTQNLKALKLIGPIAIVVELILHKKQIDDWLKNHGLGWMTQGILQDVGGPNLGGDKTAQFVGGKSGYQKGSELDQLYQAGLAGQTGKVNVGGGATINTAQLSPTETRAYEAGLAQNKASTGVGQPTYSRGTAVYGTHPPSVIEGVKFTGKSLTGVNVSLAEAVANAVKAKAGDLAVVVVNSAKRPPGPGNDVKNSNHITGNALDAYVVTNKGNIPIGTLLKDVAPKYGLRSGDVAGFDPKTRGGFDPYHVDNGANVGGVTGSRTQAATAASRWPASATLAYSMAVRAGLNAQQAKDFATVQYGESGFDPTNYVGKSDGKPYVPYKTAGGLYQLLSKGYVDTANKLGGVFNPAANIQTILPDYVKYYRSHPFQPGAAGAAVEKSGEGAAYYAQGYSHLPGFPGSVTTGPTGTFVKSKVDIAKTAAAQFKAAKTAAAASYELPASFTIPSLKAQLNKSTADDLKIVDQEITVTKKAINSKKLKGNTLVTAWQKLVELTDQQHSLMGDKSKPTAAGFELPPRYGVAEAKAKLSEGVKDDLKVVDDETTYTKKAIASKKLKGQALADALNQLGTLKDERKQLTPAPKPPTFSMPIRYAIAAAKAQLNTDVTDDLKNVDNEIKYVKKAIGSKKLKGQALADALNEQVGLSGQRKDLRAQLAPTFSMPIRFAIKEARAQLNTAVDDDLRSVDAEIKYVKKAIASKKLKGQALLDALNELAGLTGQRKDLRAQLPKTAGGRTFDLSMIVDQTGTTAALTKLPKIEQQLKDAGGLSGASLGMLERARNRLQALQQTVTGRSAPPPIANELGRVNEAIDRAGYLRRTAAPVEKRFAGAQTQIEKLNVLSQTAVPGVATDYAGQINKLLADQINALKAGIAKLKGAGLGASAEAQKMQAELQAAVSSQQSALQQAVSTARNAYDSAISSFSSSFDRVASEIDAQFQAQTEAYIRTVIAPQFFQNGALTPSESALQQMQQQDTQTALQDALTQAQKDNDQKAIAQARRAIAENNLSIQATRERAKADQDYAASVDAYRESQAIKQQQLDASLADLKTGVENGSKSMTDLQPILDQFGIALSTGGTQDGATAAAYQFASDLAAATTGSKGIVTTLGKLQDAFDALTKYLNNRTGNDTGSDSGSGGGGTPSDANSTGGYGTPGGATASSGGATVGANSPGGYTTIAASAPGSKSPYRYKPLFEQGGVVDGAYTGRPDTVEAMLTQGERVLTREQTSLFDRVVAAVTGKAGMGREQITSALHHLVERDTSSKLVERFQHGGLVSGQIPYLAADGLITRTGVALDVIPAGRGGEGPVQALMKAAAAARGGSTLSDVNSTGSAGGDIVPMMQHGGRISAAGLAGETVVPAGRSSGGNRFNDIIPKMAAAGGFVARAGVALVHRGETAIPAGVIPSEIPKMAAGGFVAKTGVALGHRGETVVPAAYEPLQRLQNAGPSRGANSSSTGDGYGIPKMATGGFVTKTGVALGRRGETGIPAAAYKPLQRLKRAASGGGTSPAANSSSTGGYGIPHLATGGLITRTGVALVHRGETVTPAGKGGGDTFHFSFPNYVGSQAELTDTVIAGLRRANRSGKIRDFNFS